MSNFLTALIILATASFVVYSAIVIVKEIVKRKKNGKIKTESNEEPNKEGE